MMELQVTYSKSIQTCDNNLLLKGIFVGDNAALVSQLSQNPECCEFSGSPTYCPKRQELLRCQTPLNGKYLVLQQKSSETARLEINELTAFGTILSP